MMIQLFKMRVDWFSLKKGIVHRHSKAKYIYSFYLVFCLLFVLAISCTDDESTNSPNHQITSIIPDSAHISETITIHGSGFGNSQGTSVVSFLGPNGSEISEWNDTELNHYGLKSIGLTMNKFFIPI